MTDYIYDSRGRAVGYIRDRYIYAMNGQAIGQINVTHVYKLSGGYVGELHKDMIVNKHLGTSATLAIPAIREMPGIQAIPEIAGR